MFLEKFLTSTDNLKYDFFDLKLVSFMGGIWAAFEWSKNPPIKHPYLEM